MKQWAGASTTVAMGRTKNHKPDRLGQSLTGAWPGCVSHDARYFAPALAIVGAIVGFDGLVVLQAINLLTTSPRSTVGLGVNNFDAHPRRLSRCVAYRVKRNQRLLD